MRRWPHTPPSVLADEGRPRRRRRHRGGCPPSGGGDGVALGLLRAAGGGAAGGRASARPGLTPPRPPPGGGAGRAPAPPRAAARLVGERADAPRGLLRLAYPDEYMDLAADGAEANGFPPLLLLALVRQESYFDPDAESSAG